MPLADALGRPLRGRAVQWPFPKGITSWQAMVMNLGTMPLNLPQYKLPSLRSDVEPVRLPTEGIGGLPSEVLHEGG